MLLKSVLKQVNLNPRGFVPTNLFVNSEAGAWYDPSDISTLAQNSDGTGSVSVGDPVGFVDDKANDLDATQATSSKRPVLRDTPLRLELDKADDNLEVTIPTGGIVGTLLIGTTGGIVQAEVDIPAGTWTLAQGGGTQYPGVDLVGLVLIDRSLGSSEKSDAIIWLQSKGAGPVDFSAGATNRGNWFKDWGFLTTLDVSTWDTSQVTDFRVFAHSCSSLTTLDVSAWDTSQVTDFEFFAFGCSSLTTLDVSAWNTSQVTNFQNFALDCSSLTTLDVSAWDTSQVTDFQNFARGCSSLTTLDVSTWDTSQVTNFQNFARDCSSLTTLDVSAWNTSQVTDFAVFAFGCSSLTTLDVSNWDTSQVTDFRVFARGCSSLTTITVNGGTGNPFADSPCTDYNNAFINTDLDQGSIDDILVAIEAAGTSNGDFDQSGGSAPSATGETAIDALRSRGWTINVTGGY